MCKISIKIFLKCNELINSFLWNRLKIPLDIDLENISPIRIHRTKCTTQYSPTARLFMSCGVLSKPYINFNISALHWIQMTKKLELNHNNCLTTSKQTEKRGMTLKCLISKINSQQWCGMFQHHFVFIFQIRVERRVQAMNVSMNFQPDCIKNIYSDKEEKSSFAVSPRSQARRWCYKVRKDIVFVFILL